MSTGCDLQEEEALLKRDQKEYFFSSRFHCHIIKQNMKLRTGSLGPFSSPPSSKCFHFLIASILLELQLGSTSFQPQHNLLCSFSLFVENWLSLITIATLLPVIKPLTPYIQRVLTLLVPCDYLGLMFATLTGSPVGFGNIPHVCKSATGTEKQTNF